MKQLWIMALICLLMASCDTTASVTDPPPLQTSEATQATSENGSGLIPRGLLDEIEQETEEDAVIFACIDQIEALAEGTDFRDGDEIPDDVLVSIDLDAIYESWSEYPLRPICYKDNWGLFVSTRAFEAPYRGDYWLLEEASP